MTSLLRKLDRNVLRTLRVLETSRGYCYTGCMPEHTAVSRIGTEPVGRLLFQFSLPAITGMVVNALYNVIDSIWVGRGVNEIALAGLSLVMPLMTVFMAFAMLFGIGAANLISMRLGQGRKDDAENALNHCFFLLLGIGVFLMVAGLVWIDPILSLMGAEKGSPALEFAHRYLRIILFGAVFSMVGFGFSHCTRAQGFPVITMISMIIGAGMNMVLDPVFIIVFGWGVEGAAWATIVSQLASAVWILLFSVNKKAVIRLDMGYFRPSFRVVLDIMSFGISQFILQFLMSGVQLLFNTSMGWYGAPALGPGGGDVALSGMRMNMAVLMMILMPVFGINQGAQPILGYNYGARQFGRVRHTLLLAILWATYICAAGFAVVQLFSRQLVMLFVPDGSPVLFAFAPKAMRTAAIMLPVTGFQIVATNFFVVTGRPKVSIFLSLLRQCIVLIPCIFLFGRIWGLWGIIGAMPVADGFAFVCTGLLTLFELRKLQHSSITKQPEGS